MTSARSRRRWWRTALRPAVCADRLARAWEGGWLCAAQHVPSPNFGKRPGGALPVLAVLHSISLPPGRCGGPAIARFFTNRLSASGHPFFAQIAGLQVSAHFLVRREGQILQFVDVAERAWHAGTSCWRGVDNRNDDSVGIEIEGLEGRTFTAAQYRAVARLLRALVARWPIREAVGHEHIAPQRKRDPGPGWRWQRLAHRLQGWPLAVTPASASATELRALAASKSANSPKA